MAAAKQVDLVVITPERKVIETAVDAVVLPAHDGELGILAGRSPLVCELGIGQLRYTHGGQQCRMFIDGGFAQVLQNHVTVLTDAALAQEQVTPAVLSGAEQAAETVQGHDPETLRSRQRAQQRVRALRRLQVG
jgi:F-type H+-transporting ATPase subunit epsilon